MSRRFRCSLLLSIVMLAGAAERPGTNDPLDRALEGLLQFSFDWPQAIFRTVRTEETAGSERWQRASFGLATCLHQASPVKAEAITEADQIFAEIVASTPDSHFAPQSLLNRGRIAELIDYYQDPVDLPAARIHYRMVMERWPGLPIASEAAFRLAGSHVQTNEPDDIATAITILTDWLAAHPGDPFASAMWHYLGDAYFMHQRDYPAALHAYRQADELGLIWPGRESIVWWRMARLAEEHLGDRELAVRYYTRICTDAQTSGRAFEAQIALARLGAPVPELSAFAAYPGERPDLSGLAEEEPAP